MAKASLSKQKVEDILINLIEKGEIIWRRPWLFESPDVAFSPDGKCRPYRGINTLVTAAVRASKGQKSHVWLTYDKIQQLNGRKYDETKGRYVGTGKTEDRTEPLIKIRKGAKGVPIIYCNRFQKKDENGNPVFDEKGNPVEIPFLRHSFVYNADDIENFRPEAFEPESEDTGINVSSCIEAENLLLSLYKGHPPVRHGGNSAFYRPLDDSITVPEHSRFLSVNAFVSCLAHELAHSTGSQGRLGRKFGSQGSVQYAKEELIAEFTASMVLAELGISEMPEIENSAAYIQSWLSVIKDNPGILFDSIVSAGKATDMIMGRSQVTGTTAEIASAEAEAV